MGSWLNSCLLISIKILVIKTLTRWLCYISDVKIRQKRRVQKKVSNVSETLSRDVVRKEIQLALGSLACTIHFPKRIRGKRGRPGPQGSMVRPGPRDHKGLKALKEFRDLLVPKAIKVLKDPKGILVIPSQLPLLSHHRFLWWLTKLMQLHCSVMLKEIRFLK